MSGPYGIFQNANDQANYNARQQGLFGQFPLMTPKYARNTGLRDAEFRDTLARLYIQLPATGDPTIDKTVRDQYLASLPGDAATQALATVLLGSTTSGGTGFVNFFLTQANEPTQEIMQVDKVMSDDYVTFFYGQQPPTFQYSGVLLNSLQDDHRGDFARAYQLMLRGTQLARRQALVRLRYDSVIVTGALYAHQQTLNAENELAVPFSFSLLVKDYTIITTLPFAKLTAQAYVKLAADAAIAALQPVVTQTTQTNTTVVTPPNPAAVSTAGAPQNTTVTNPNQNAAQQTVAKGAAAATPPPVNSNIKGTVTPPPPTPPTPPT